MSLSNIKEHTRQVVKLPDGKVIGYIENETFIKEVLGSKHKLRCPPSWCISAYAFENEIKPNVTQIIVRDKESDIIYQTSIDNFVEHCFEIQRSSFEKQLALTLNYWQKEENGKKQLRLWETN